ncbi:MAG: cobalamin-dependent protein [Oligoflexia bacterium]|nr:cobalamin-dependent protein [Oligoflexia bacterium]
MDTFITNRSHLVFIYPRETDPPLEITSFKCRMARYGLLSIASHLQSLSYKVTVFDELVGGKIDWDIVNSADYVCISFLSFCARKAYKISAKIKKNNRAIIIMGGPHASVLPEDALEHCDYVVRNEGEDTLVELLNFLENKNKKKNKIENETETETETETEIGKEPICLQGISYRDKCGRIVHCPDRPFNTNLDYDFDISVIPEYKSLGLLWNIKDTLVNGMPRIPMPVIQASRGCPSQCTFCTVKHQLGLAYRKKDIAKILNEINSYTKVIKNPYVLFADNDLSVDIEFSTELFTAIYARYGRYLRPYLFSRITIANHEKLLNILSKFEHTTIGIGFESLDDLTLNNICKGQTVASIRNALKQLKQKKLHIHGLFLFGTESDWPESVDQAINFSLEWKLFNVGLCSLYDFPTRYKVLKQQQLIVDEHFIHHDWRFYNGNFVVHFPKNIRPSVLQRNILNGYEKFNVNSHHGMGSFMPTRPTILKYIKFLEGIEKDYYDSQGLRIDESTLLNNAAGRSELPIFVSQSSLYMESFKFLSANLFRRISWQLLLKMFFNKSCSRE